MIHAKSKVVCESANRVTCLVAVLVYEAEQSRADTGQTSCNSRCFSRHVLDGAFNLHGRRVQAD